MTQRKSTPSDKYARYLELSRILGIKTTLLIESSADDTLEVHLEGRSPEEAALMREAYAIYRKWNDPTADITGHPV